MANDHAGAEDYVFLGPVTVSMETDDDLSAGMVLVSGEMVKPAERPKASLVLPDGRKSRSGPKP